MSKDMQRLAVEEWMYKLIRWSDDNMDNDNVSDSLYKFVHDITVEVIAELDELEREIILGGAR